MSMTHADSDPDRDYLGWCLVETLLSAQGYIGGGPIGGAVTLRNLAGAVLVLIEMPDPNSAANYGLYVPLTSVFSITPTTQEQAIDQASRSGAFAQWLTPGVDQPRSVERQPEPETPF